MISLDMQSSPRTQMIQLSRSERRCSLPEDVMDLPSETLLRKRAFLLQKFHSHLFCPARNITCYFCPKRGHYSKVCLSRNSSTTSRHAAPVVNDWSVVGVGRQFLASTPTCLESAVVDGTLEGVTVEVFVDFGASENFVDHNIARRLKLIFGGSPAHIGMASSNVRVRTLWRATGTLNLLDRTYPSAHFSVMDNLCADVVVGQEFLR